MYLVVIVGFDVIIVALFVVGGDRLVVVEVVLFAFKIVFSFKVVPI